MATKKKSTKKNAGTKKTTKKKVKKSTSARKPTTKKSTSKKAKVNKKKATKKKSTATKRTTKKKVTTKKVGSKKKTAKKTTKKKATTTTAKSKKTASKRKTATSKATTKKAKRVSTKKKSSKSTPRTRGNQKKTVSFPGQVQSQVGSGEIKIGRPVPSFTLSSTGDKPFIFDEYKGTKGVVLFFYPKDNTPGCTQEGHEFTELVESFKAKNFEVFGVSKDSLKSHCGFKDKQGYKVDLLSDETEELCNLFGVMKEKNMYGRKYFGIERSTFVISESGELLKEWRGVKVPGHASEVLDSIGQG